MPFDTETTLTLLDAWLTTQASSLVRGFTETGPTPTGISAISEGLLGWVTSNTDNESFAVLTAKSRVPSAESRIGLVWAASKFANAAVGPSAVVAGTRTKRATRVAR